MDIHSSLTGLTHQEIQEKSADLNTGQYKLLLADIVNEKLSPIRDKITQLRNNKDFVEKVLEKGKHEATEIASNNLHEIKQIIGLK